MPLQFDQVKGNMVSVAASGRLTDEDYDRFVPEMERLIKQWGRLRMLFDMRDFRGWDLHSVWDEFKFHARHRQDLKRVAVVGNKNWEKWARKVSRLFTGSDVRYFDEDDIEEARYWLASGW